MIQQFCFKNFKPNSKMDQYARTMITRLMEAAPYESTQNAEIIRENDHYRVKIEIWSGYGPFTAVSISSDCKEAIDQAEGQISKQLSQWKQLRFIPSLDDKCFTEPEAGLAQKVSPT